MRGESCSLIRMSPMAHELAADSFLLQGRMDEALAERRRVIELDPLNALGYANYAGELLAAGRPAEALVQVDRAIALDPRDLRNTGEKARILLDLNRNAEALMLARQAMADPFFKAGALKVLVTVGGPADIALAKEKASQSSDVAKLNLYLGLNDAFLAWLETTQVTNVGALLFDPALDPLRDTARYQAWLIRTNLRDAQARATAWRAAHPSPSPGSK